MKRNADGSWECSACRAWLHWSVSSCEGHIDVADPSQGELEDIDATHATVRAPPFPPLLARRVMLDAVAKFNATEHGFLLLSTRLVEELGRGLELQLTPKYCDQCGCPSPDTGHDSSCPYAPTKCGARGPSAPVQVECLKLPGHEHEHQHNDLFWTADEWWLAHDTTRHPIAGALHPSRHDSGHS